MEPFPRPLYDELSMLILRGHGRILQETEIHAHVTQGDVYLVCDPTWTRSQRDRVRHRYPHEHVYVVSAGWVLDCISDFCMIPSSPYH